MFELFTCVLVFWLGFQFGKVATSWKLRDLIINEAKKEGIIDRNYNIITPETKPTVAKLWVEKVQDMLYLYDTENTFICQATTLEDLANDALKYKNIKYASVVNGNDVFAFINGTVKPASEVLK